MAVGGNIAGHPSSGRCAAYNTTASVTTNAKMSHSSLQAVRLATCNRVSCVSNELSARALSASKC